MLNSVNVLVLGSVLSIGGAPRPGGIGIQVRGRSVLRASLGTSRPAWHAGQSSLFASRLCAPQDYGGGVKTLALCPSTPNCIATSEEANDPTHYVPAW